MSTSSKQCPILPYLRKRILTATAAAPKAPQRSTSNIFSSAAPSANVLLPTNEIITFVKTIVYLSNALRNHYVLMRLVQGGLDQITLANIANMHRS